jgi:sporulation protein YlmC with PRC-barrel domain
LFAVLLLGAAADPSAPAAKVEQVRKAHAESLLGQPITNTTGDIIGHVVDVLIDDSGKPHAAVIEFTGFFGIGDRRVAVAWDALDFSVQGDHIAISTRLDAARLKAMPEYKVEANSVPVATPSAKLPPKPH